MFTWEMAAHIHCPGGRGVETVIVAWGKVQYGMHEFMSWPAKEEQCVSPKKMDTTPKFLYSG